MSYSICRIAKIKTSGVTGIQIHDTRQQGKSHTNPDIQWDKVKDNIHLITPPESFRKDIKAKIEALNLPKAIRSDATVMVQAMITSDNAFFDKMPRSEQIEFFKKSLGFVQERYGEKNIVSATVHFDEATPHMHVNFVPVTSDGRLSARDLFSPKQLRTLQDDFNAFCNANGYDLERGKVDSKTKHLSVQEFKVESKLAEMKDKMSEIEKLEGELSQKRDTLENDLKTLQERFKRSNEILSLQDDLNAIEGKMKRFKRGITEVRSEDFAKLKEMALSLPTYQKKIEVLEKEISTLGEYKQAFEKQGTKMERLENEKYKLDRAVDNLTGKLNRLLVRSEYLDEFLKEHGLLEEAEDGLKTFKQEKQIENQLKPKDLHLEPEL
jgi:hypothetical protein